MKTQTKPLIAAAVAISPSAGIAAVDQQADRTKIEAILSAYETALNASDTNTVMTLYADDGVFMAQHSAPNVGTEAVRAAYDGVFQAITLDVEFTVDEILQVSPEWAFARTRSEGFVTITATGDKGPKPTRSCSFSKSWMTATGRSPGTASQPPIHRVSKGGPSNV